MDNSKEFQIMLDTAIKAHPNEFNRFDRAKNVQDQLQEMVGKHLWNLNGKFYEWLFDSIQDGWHINHNHLNFTSMEQLWLAFVMYSLYRKIWNGEDWVEMKRKSLFSRAMSNSKAFFEKQCKSFIILGTCLQKLIYEGLRARFRKGQNDYGIQLILCSRQGDWAGVFGWFYTSGFTSFLHCLRPHPATFKGELDD